MLRAQRSTLLSKLDALVKRPWAVCGAILTLLTVSAAAQSTSFNIGSGNWQTAGLWTSGIPNASQTVYIGSSSGNTATITSANAASGNAYLGYLTGQIGAVEVDGGRQWNLGANTLNVGYFGEGILSIYSGTVTSGYAVLGAQTDSYGSAVVSTGGTWNATNALVLGDYGYANVTVEAGGQLNAGQGTYLAQNSGSYASVAISNAASVWDSGLTFQLGIGGSGNLRVENGGTLQAVDSSIGHEDQGYGSAMITGTNSRWENTGTLTIDNGNLTVDGGAVVTDDIGQIRGGYGTTVEVTVTGTGSLWQNTTSLDLQNGTVIVEAGGKLTSGSSSLNGYADRVDLTVTGTDSRWENGGNILLDNANVAIRSGGYVSTNSLQMDEGGTSQASVLVRGDGSTLDIATSLDVTGTFTVEDGGTVTSATGTIGNASGATAEVMVRGVNSTWTNTNDITIFNNATLAVQGGGKVTADSVTVTANGGPGGSVQVSDANSTLEIAGDFTMGYGSVVVENGATMSNQDTYLGDGSGVEDVVALILGAGTRWENSGEFELTNSHLTVGSGGTLTSASASIATSEGFDALQANVSGANSQWDNAGDMAVGGTSNGFLWIEQGGKVSTGSASISGLTGSSAVGQVMVTGAGSQFEVDGHLTVGHQGGGSAALNINNGATAMIGSASVLGQTSSAVVTDAGSHWTVAGNLSIVDAPVTVAAGATLTAGSVTMTADQASLVIFNLTGSAGTASVLEIGSIRGTTGSEYINVNNGIIRATVNGATLIDNVQVSAGALGMTIDTQAFNVSVNSSITSNGQFKKTGTGRLTLDGNATFNAGATVTAGGLWINGTASGAITLQSGASLGGSGTVTSSITVASGVTLAPGNSPGTLNTGTQTWNGGGNYQWETNSVNGTAGTNSDLILINGDLNIAATSGNRFTITINSLTMLNDPGLLAVFNPTANYTWEIVRVTGNINGFNTTDFTIEDAAFINDIQNGYFDVSQVNDSLYLNYNAATVPEPGGAFLLMAAGVTMLLRKRRMRRA